MQKNGNSTEIGNGKFADVTSSQDPAFRAPRVGRGLAVGDYDNDGWLDLLVTNNGENAQLFRNAGGSEPAAQKNHWLGVRLIGTKSNRDGIGSALKITAGDLVSHDQAKGGMSYCSRRIREYILGWDNTPKSTPWKSLGRAARTKSSRMFAADQYVTIDKGKGLNSTSFRAFESEDNSVACQL